jgi:hypothetical protein
MAKHSHLPKYNELLNPSLQALHDLGGPGTIEEVPSNVSAIGSKQMACNEALLMPT